jgi:fatty acid desaturase
MTDPDPDLVRASVYPAPDANPFHDDIRPARGVGRGGVKLPPHVLAPLVELDDARSLREMAPTVIGLALVIGLAATLWTPWVVLPAILVIAVLQHAVFVLVHDAAHLRLFSGRRLNDAVGCALGAIVGISMCTYRVVHRLHHNHLYGDVDPDIALHGGYPRGRAYLLRKLATDLSGRTAWKTYRYFFGAPAADARTGTSQRPLDDTPASMRADALRDRRTVIGVQLALPLGILALAGWDGLLKYGVLWLLPALTVLQAILRLRAIAEHGAPAGYDSPLTAARTHLAGPLARAVLFPHHVGHHIEHHLYPAVPHYRLPALHAALHEQGMLDGAQVGAFGETWRRVYAERADRSVRAA